MLVDLEPGYERLHVGDRIEATTQWCRPETLPADVVSWDLPVHVERVATNRTGDYDWIARTDGHLAALLSDWKESEGPTAISGCLMYERYLQVSPRGADHAWTHSSSRRHHGRGTPYSDVTRGLVGAPVGTAYLHRAR